MRTIVQVTAEKSLLTARYVEGGMLEGAKPALSPIDQQTATFRVSCIQASDSIERNEGTLAAQILVFRGEGCVLA
jgi:hypothetical protein